MSIRVQTTVAISQIRDQLIEQMNSVPKKSAQYRKLSKFYDDVMEAWNEVRAGYYQAVDVCLETFTFTVVEYPQNNV